MGTAALIVALGCGRESGTQRTPDEGAKTAAPSTPGAPAPPAAPSTPGAPGKPRPPSRLPEDPIAGKRSEKQWREHLEEEERERQVSFDRRRLKQHRAVLRQLASARAQYDRARSEAALAKARDGMPKRIAELRRQMDAIDPDRNSSRVVPDYEALTTALSETYPAAKLAALKGDASALQNARAAFDQRIDTIKERLEEAAESEDEY